METMENRDIKDFQSVSAVAELDNILLVQSSGVNGKMTVSLFKTAIKNDVTPSIKDNVWWIGTVNTGVTAAGKTPEFRKGDLGIEWKYTTDTSWKLLVNYESISLTFDDLTDEQKDSLKLHFGDLTEEDIAELQQPAQDMIAELEDTNTRITNAEKLRVEAENKRQTDTAAAIRSAEEAAEAANTAAENVEDGKTPVFGIGSVSQGASASATVTTDGTDASGNPKYKINLVLPKGDKGDTGKTPAFSIGTVTKGESASATVTSDGTDVSGNPKYKINLVLPKGDTGDDGKTPVLEFGTITTGDPGTQASATLTDNGTTTEGNPKYLLSLTIPRGDKGLPGEGSGNVSASGTGLVAGKQYLFVPSSSGSTEGRFVEYTEPDIPEQVQPDWNATSGKGAILNKPTVPTKVSQLTNDSNYVNKTYVDEEIGKIPTPDVSAQIETHNMSETAHPDIRTLITNYLATAKGYTDDKISDLVGTAPEVLDTLGELAEAVLNNQDAVTAINNAIAQKLGKTEAQSLYVALQGYVAYSQAEKNKLAGIEAGANKFPDAPSDNKQYGRKNGGWSEIEASSSVGIGYYDASWLLGMESGDTCTQEQYTGLLNAINRHDVIGPLSSGMASVDEDGIIVILFSYFAPEGSYLLGFQWMVAPNLLVDVTESYLDLSNLSGGAEGPTVEYPSVNSDGSVLVALKYNKFFIVTGAKSISVFTLNLNEAEEGVFQFTCGSTPVTLHMSSDIKWINEPEIEANKTYQVSVLNKIAVIGGVE